MKKRTGWHHSAETKAKIGRSHMGLPAHITDESRAKMSESQKRHGALPEVRAMRSANAKALWANEDFRERHAFAMKAARRPIPRIRQSGYVFLYRPLHPGANGTGYVRAHRLVMEEKLGRYLETNEIVHHIDGNCGNNCPENLLLLSSQADHRKVHIRNIQSAIANDGE